MSLQPIKTFQGAVFAVLCSVALLGCGRQKATERVLEAVNPKQVEIINGHAAILRLGDGYAAILPTYVRHNEIKYRVFTSSTGVFQANGKPVQEGVVTTTSPVDVGECPGLSRVWWRKHHIRNAGLR
jgi:hypothetical protein